MIVLAGILILLAAFGLFAAVRLLRKRKTLFILCTIFCTVVIFVSSAFIWLSIYFGWAVHNQEPKEPPADDAYIAETEELP